MRLDPLHALLLPRRFIIAQLIFNVAVSFGGPLFFFWLIFAENVQKTHDSPQLAPPPRLHF